MKHYFSIALKSKGLDILNIRFGTINLDVQYMNKAIVETVLDNEFKRNMHRKYSVSFCRWKVQLILSSFHSGPINPNIQGL